MSRPIAAALDLGSTRIKLALLHENGELQVIAHEPFPLLAGSGLRYEIDLAELERSATSLVQRAPRDLPLGIASQRSSFALWNAKTGEPVAEALSWRDRRAARWCEVRAPHGAELAARSGLRLSPHYVGPKLAHLFETRADLRASATRGELAFGTLETFLMWRWSDGKCFSTDATMAARTLLVDALSGTWDRAALAAFGADSLQHARIEPSCGRRNVLDDHRVVAATLSDQASGVIAVARRDDTLVNFGTGAFVLRHLGELQQLRELTELRREFAGALETNVELRYLVGPILWTATHRVFAREGTINGGGSTLARFGESTTALDAHDSEPELFASPDESGLGAPRWIASAGVEFSRSDAELAARRRAWLEGLVFRVREIVEDIAAPQGRVLVSGGLAREAFVAPALATCLGRPVEVLDEVEATLLGAARLAAGLDPYAEPRTTIVEPREDARWIAAKFERWREWMARRWNAP